MEADLAALRARAARADELEAQNVSLRARAARVDELEAQVAALSVVAAVPPPCRMFPSVDAALAESTLVTVASPSKAPVGQRMQPDLANFDFCASPLSPSLRILSVSASLVAWKGVAADDLLNEKEA